MIYIIVNAAGVLGVFLILLAYGMLQFHKCTSHSANYLWLNLNGALLILISLIYAWNLPAFLMETAWMAVSIHSIYKVKHQRCI